MINRREILEFLIRCDRFFTVKSTIKSDIKCQLHQGSVRSRLRQSEYCYFMCSVPLQSCSPFSLSFFPVKICFQLANIKFKSAPPLFGEQCIRNWTSRIVSASWFRRNNFVARKICYSTETHAVKLTKNLPNERKEKTGCGCNIFFSFRPKPRCPNEFSETSSINWTVYFLK